MTQARNREIIRLAHKSDYPASHLLDLSTNIPTGDDFTNAFDIAEQALGQKVQQGSLFTYLFRRFGYPNKGSDPDKNLASYMLTTTHPGMLLEITPYAGGDTSISFRFLVSHETYGACSEWISRARHAHQAAFLDWIEEQGRVPDWADEAAEMMDKGGWPVPPGAEGWRRMMSGIAVISYGGVKEGDHSDKVKVIEWYQSVKADYEAQHPVPEVQWRSGNVAEWENDDPMKPFAEAMTETLRDLLRPVWIRDVAIGIHGPYDEDDEDEIEPEQLGVEHSNVAGYPSGDLGNLDPAGFAKLHEAILKLDPDPQVAIARALKLLQVNDITDGACGD